MCEVGVWNFECEIVKVVCKVVIKIVKKESEVVFVMLDNIDDFFGVLKYCYGLVEKED